VLSGGPSGEVSGLVRAQRAVCVTGSGCAGSSAHTYRDAHSHPQTAAAAQAAVLQALSQRVYAAGRCPLGRARALLVPRAVASRGASPSSREAPGGDERLPHLQRLDEAILTSGRRHRALAGLAALLPCCPASNAKIPVPSQCKLKI